jgi:hypothetical protein
VGLPQEKHRILDFKIARQKHELALLSTSWRPLRPFFALFAVKGFTPEFPVTQHPRQLP